MFDISFTELIVIAVVALVVIGPERLPKVARTAGLLLGRLQRYVSDVKSDIQREMQLEELKKLQAEVAESARQVEEKLTTDLRDAEKQLQSGFAEVKGAGDDVAQALSDTVATAEQAGHEITAAGEAPASAEPSATESPVAVASTEVPTHSGLGSALPTSSSATEPVAKG
ncbi:Sec-independent protein translocase subunit B [Oryzomicrobium terrae]|uniref:Sec-independent protein translocase protein TatB n=1 Tax=Oryzomicrobium terrae TaxID=1735038 RepID=A0A5C1EAG8_9RHOO|nr:Sec-independent protein translocase protein TatB [Oryzomicrobium terrae]QEL65900.1 Sec-independent protein translocase subunit B [Oryzomicrobium terrae]